MLVTEITPDQLRSIAFAVMQIALLGGFVGYVLGVVAVTALRGCVRAFRGRRTHQLQQGWLDQANARLHQRRKANGY